MADKYPKLAVDVLVEDKGKILLIKRNFKPFKGKWALPGGFVEEGETVEEAATREIKEETGIDAELRGILGVYSDPKRDPRGHIISIVFFAGKKGGKVEAGEEIKDIKWVSLEETEEIDFAFDHETIIEDYRIIKMDMRARG